MVTHARGMICVGHDRTSAPTNCNLLPMVTQNTAMRGTAFTVTIDYLHGTTTGISAYGPGEDDAGGGGSADAAG